jgi:hypothetical protein
MIARLRVGYRRYKIRTWTRDDVDATGSHGQCDSTKGIISVCVDDEPLRVLDTLLHEILHAIWAEYGLGENEPEERAVSVLATGFTQVMHDNPQLQREIAKLHKAENEATK